MRLLNVLHAGIEDRIEFLRVVHGASANTTSAAIEDPPLRLEPEEQPIQQEQDDLLASIRAGKPLFEGDFGALSSMTGILGRMALYSGQEVTWDQAIKSNKGLLPEKLAMDAKPPVLPDEKGFYSPLPVPGVTKPW